VRPAEPKLANIAMAIFHAQISVVSRSTGQSACGSAAYCSGERIVCERLDIAHDHSKKKGVDYSEIISPIIDGSKFDGSRTELWNLVEASEKRHDSQLARMVVVAIPVELDDRSKIALVREFVNDNFVAKGMIADINIHDINSHNPHAHIMLSMRDLVKNSEGKIEFGKKNREWNDRHLVKEQREKWAATANKYLAQVGDLRIDHRSLKDRGIDQVPQIHLGSAASAMEKRGIETRRGDRHREIATVNLEIVQGQGQIKNIDRQINLETHRQQQETERQRIQSEIRQREEAQRQQLIQFEIQRQNRELERKLESEKILQDFKDTAERDTIEALENLRLKFEQITKRAKSSKETIDNPIVEIKEKIEPEEPKFTIPFMIEAFTHMVEQYPKGQTCEIFKVTGNFLVRGIKDVPDSRLELERMMRRILDYGGREHTKMIPLSMVVDELKLARDNPIAKVKTKTQIKTTRSKDIDYSDSKSESQDQGYSM
jgi:hypothetical protein